MRFFPEQLLLSMRALSLLGFCGWILRIPVPDVTGRPVTLEDSTQQIAWVKRMSPWSLHPLETGGWETPLGVWSYQETGQMVETIVLLDHLAASPSLWAEPNLYLDAREPNALYGATKIS